MAYCILVTELREQSTNPYKQLAITLNRSYTRQVLVFRGERPYLKEGCEEECKILYKRLHK